MTLQRLARPKVNLFLHVTGRREDGYHLLESLVCFPEGGDVLTVEHSDRLSFQGAGPFAGEMGDGADNLVMRAANLLGQEYGVSSGAIITLDKRLPVASGVGGGSSDAAAALHLLCDLWQLQVPRKKLMQMGEKLGADVPVCLHGASAIMSGIGEVITPVPPLPEFAILLINPGVAVSTPAIFGRLNLKFETRPVPSFSGMTFAGLIAGLKQTGNDMQDAAIDLVPEIKQSLQAIGATEGCRLARMSGSGATCFGLYESRIAAEKAKETILREYPGWWALASSVSDASS